MNWQEVCDHPNLKDLPFKLAVVFTIKIKKRLNLWSF
jgi:hypothetical protein